jgi:Fe2+ or Zn2+ uptake regulation protein
MKRERDQVASMLSSVRGAGLKLTPQRMAIVEELAADETHPTAQDIFDRLRAKMPTMSFATVYNTLDALSRAGLCTTLSLSPGSGRFDPNMAPHHHAVCDGCGAIRDVFPPAVRPRAEGPGAAESAAEALAVAAPGFEVRSVERIFRGLCAHCARGRRRPSP